MEKVFFKPWKGSSYDSGIHGKKIMVLGHIHVCGGCNQCGDITEVDDECAQFTINAVNNYLKWRETGEIPSPGYEGWLKTFLHFTKAFFGYEPDFDEEKNELWNHILFYNYVQTSVPDWDVKPTYNDYEKSKEPFIDVINEYSPDVIIAWGKDVYDKTPDGGEHGTPLVFDNIRAEQYIYTLYSGKKCTMIKIHHPCMYFSWTKWHEIIKQAL